MNRRNTATGCQSPEKRPRTAMQSAPTNTICDARNVERCVNLGFHHLEQGNWEEALLYFGKVIELQPDNPEAYNNMGYVHESMDRLATAMQLYRRALELDERNVEAIINIAHIKDLEGDYYGALQNYTAALVIEPDNINVHFCLGTLYDRYDMFDEAMGQYEEVLDREPTHQKAILTSAICTFKWGITSPPLHCRNFCSNMIREMPLYGIISVPSMRSSARSTKRSTPGSSA